MSYIIARQEVYDPVSGAWVRQVGNASGSQNVQAANTEQAALTAGVLNADLVPSTDVSAYRWLSLQILGTWVGTLTFQGSNDNSNWVTVALQTVLATGSSAQTTATATGIYAGPINFRYFRVRMTAYTSGTATGVLELSTLPGALTALGVLAAQSGTWTVQPGNTPNTSAWLVQQVPGAGGGLSTNRFVSAASNNATAVKGSAGQLYGLVVSNVNAAVRYVKLYNKATAPAPASDNALLIGSYAIPASGQLSLYFPDGIAFSTGIGLALVTGISDTDNTSVAASEHLVNVYYK